MVGKLIIKGRLPGLNELIDAERRNKFEAAKLKSDTEQYIMLCARRLGKIQTPVIMHYTWIEPNRKRDKDNICGFGRKVIQDALVKGGHLPGDGWKYIEGFTDRFEIDPKNPRVEVVFEEVKK